jgi:hypothetical protein
MLSFGFLPRNVPTSGMQKLILLHSLVEASRMVLTFGIVGGYWVSSKTRTASKDLVFWK